MDVEAVLSVLSQHGLIRLNKPIGDYYSIYCPFHSDGNERRASFGVLLVDQVKNGNKYSAGFCHCFTCGYAKSLSDMVTDLLKFKHIDKSGKQWLIDNVPGYQEADSSAFESLIPFQLMDQVSSKYALDSLSDMFNRNNQPGYVSESELSNYRFYTDYMFKRGLTEEIIAKYDVGVDVNYVPPGRKRAVPCITFPVRDHTGNTLFICRRSIEGKAFYMPADIQKPVYGLYELPKHCPQLLVTESCFNALTGVKYGVPSVALFGTGTPNQINQIKKLGIPEIILGLDPDEAGSRGATRIKSRLRDSAIVRVMRDIPPGKDINDLSYEEFWSIFNTRI